MLCGKNITGTNINVFQEQRPIIGKKKKPNSINSNERCINDKSEMYK